MMGHVYGALSVAVLVVQCGYACVRNAMAGWCYTEKAPNLLAGGMGFVFVPAYSGFSLSLFCNYKSIELIDQVACATRRQLGDARDVINKTVKVAKPLRANHKKHFPAVQRQE